MARVSEESVQVLCVDDDPQLLDLTVQNIEDSDTPFNCVTATSTDEAIEIFEVNELDGIVSDYEMPGKDGLDLLEAVREVDDELPFVIFTGKGGEDIASHAIELGVSDYLQKRGRESYELLENRISNLVEQYQSKRRARELERIRRVRSDINQALVKASRRRAIEQAVCDIISEAEPYRFAWIGYPDSETDVVTPKASAGVEAGYLEEIRVTADEQATGKGPTGRAVRTGELAVMQDIPENDEYEPWREDALEHGFRSSAAIPLAFDETLFGVLNVYADRTGAFDEDERQLLAELGDTIGHALYRAEVRTRQRRAERIIDNLPVGVYRATPGPNAEVVDVNQALVEIFGADSGEDFYESNVSRLYRNETDREELSRDLQDKGVVRNREIRAETLDGDDIWISVTAMTSERDEEVYFDGIVQDITARKERELELERQDFLFKRVQDLAEIGIWEYDPRRDELTWSDGIRQIHGVAETYEPALNDAIEFYHDEDQEVIARTVDQAIETGEWQDRSLRIQRTDGELRYVRATGEVVTDEASGNHVLRGVLQDFTERKEREQELELKTRAMDKASVGILITDPTKQENPIIYANEHFQELTGYSTDEVLGRNCRFLQGEATESEPVAAMREAIDEEEPVTVELRNYRKDGSEFWNRVSIAPVENEEGQVTHFVGFQEDVTDRRVVEERLRDREEHLHQAQMVADLGSWRANLQEDKISFSDEVYDLFDPPEDEWLSYDQILESIHPEDREIVNDAWMSALEGEGYDREHRIVTSEGETRWIRVRADITFEDGEPTEAVGVVQDVTDRKAYEKRLEALNDATSRLQEANTRQEVGDMVISILSETLDEPCGCVYLLNQDTGKLEPVSYTSTDYEVTDEGFKPGEGSIGTVFVENEQMVDTDFPQQIGLGCRSVRIVPIQDVGVLLVRAENDEWDWHRTSQLVSILSRAARGALMRIDREERLDEREEQLREQAVKRDRLEQTTTQVQRVLRGVESGDSRGAIETAVCRRLAQSDDHIFAWFANVDEAAEQLVPQATAGDADGYLSEIDLSLEGSAVPPAVRAARTRDSSYVPNTAKRVQDDTWRREALARGFRSVLSIPIQLEDAIHGVLTIYSDRADGFDDFIIDIYVELGRFVAHAISCAEQRSMLASDESTEVVLNIQDEDYPWIKVANAIEEKLMLHSSLPHEDGTLAFLSVPGSTNDEVTQALRDVPLVVDLASTDNDGPLRVRLSKPDATRPLTEEGGVVSTCTVTQNNARITVRLPLNTDVRSVVNRVTDRYPDTTMVARTTIATDNQSAGFGLLEDLTPRQREALEAAYHGGCFDWPRQMTKEELAESFDISPPTYSRHLRAGQRKLLSKVFANAST